MEDADEKDYDSSDEMIVILELIIELMKEMMILRINKRVNMLNIVIKKIEEIMMI